MKATRTIFIAILILISFCIFGCKDEDDDSSVSSTIADTTAPTISSVSPADSSSDIAVNTSISITFSEAMNTSSITANTTDMNCLGSFQLSSNDFSSCVQVSAPSADAEMKVFTVQPSSDLTSSTTYRLKITTGASDIAGNILADDFSQGTGFTTATQTVTDTTADSTSDSTADTTTDSAGYGFSVSSISGNTREDATQATLTVKLKTQPTDDVTIGLSSSDETEGTVSPTSLTFTSENWDANQTVTVTGVDDSLYDGDQEYRILLAEASSSDSNYDGIDPPEVVVTNISITLDPTFNSNGYVVHNASNRNSNDEGKAITLDSNGKILVAGYSINDSSPSHSDMTIWRYNSDGSLDTSFNSSGYVVHHNAAGGNSTDIGYDITVDSNEKILVVGGSQGGSTGFDMVIWRYNADGSLDTSFGGNGYVVHNSAAGGNSSDEGRSINIDSTGKILVAGISRGSSANMAIWRYNANGSLDTSFGGVGYVVYDNAVYYSYGFGSTIDAEGKILVTGANGADMATWRYNSNGSLDTSFGGVGYVVHHNAAGGDDVDEGRAVIIDTNGKILVAGESEGVSSTSWDMTIWRYNSDGSLDTSFGGSGYVSHNSAAGGNFSDWGQAITTYSNEKILIAGFSDSISQSDEMVIWCYNNDGSLDTSFGGVGYVVHNNAAGGNKTDKGQSITIDSSGRILVAGTSFGSAPDMAIWRYRE